MKTITIFGVLLAAGALHLNAASVDISTFGAKGDGKTQNRDAINKAIETLAEAGGGTVEVPAGKWVTGSIHLRSNVTLHLDRGAVLEASSEASTYDPPEPNESDKFQDFGHSHFSQQSDLGRRIGKYCHHWRRSHFRHGAGSGAWRHRG